jgi:hypothetical protein
MTRWHCAGSAGVKLQVYGKLYDLHGWGNRQTLAGCSKRLSSKAAGESKPEAYPQGYVEDFDEPRTTLAGFFSTLLKAEDIEDDDAHKDAVVGKGSERMALHK